MGNNLVMVFWKFKSDLMVPYGETTRNQDHSHAVEKCGVDKCGVYHFVR